MGTNYPLLVYASSTGTFSSIKIVVIVSIFNNFRPIFKTDLLHVWLYEKTPIDTKVEKLEASDRDIVDYNREIYYETEDKFKDLGFEFDRSGWVSLKSEITLPLRTTTDIRVAAKNNGSPYREDWMILRITITSLSPPRNFTMMSRGDSWVQFCWLPPATEPITNYILNLEINGSLILIQSVPSTVPCLNATNLIKWSSYKAYIYAMNISSASDDRSPTSNVIFAVPKGRGNFDHLYFSSEITNNI